MSLIELLTVEFRQTSAVTSATPPGVRWISRNACCAVATVSAPGKPGAWAVSVEGTAGRRGACVVVAARRAGRAAARFCCGASTVTDGSSVCEPACAEAASEKVALDSSAAADASKALRSRRDTENMG